MTALTLSPLGWNFRNHFNSEVGTGLGVGRQLRPKHSIPDSSFLTTLSVHYCVGCCAEDTKIAMTQFLPSVRSACRLVGENS